MDKDFVKDLVSVIIPTHNRSHLLANAVNSALNQSYDHIEIIIINDCSMDNTIFIIDNITGFFGPIFGVMVADFYYVKKQKINHKELFYPKENTEYIYSSGWNYKAIYSLIIGFIFSASTI